MAELVPPSHNSFVQSFFFVFFIIHFNFFPIVFFEANILPVLVIVALSSCIRGRTIEKKHMKYTAWVFQPFDYHESNCCTVAANQPVCLQSKRSWRLRGCVWMEVWCNNALPNHVGPDRHHSINVLRVWDRHLAACLAFRFIKAVSLHTSFYKWERSAIKMGQSSGTRRIPLN